MDPWAIMGVSRDATREEIKEQWRRLCKQHHPDLQPAHKRTAAEKYFKEISSAYRTLATRGSKLAAYADFTAAQAAAARAGHPYAGGYRTAWSPGGQQSKFSNGVVAAVLAIPLIITGMWMAFSFSDDQLNQWRPDGLLAPPDNPFLHDDHRPKVHSHWRKREEQWQRELAEQQKAAAAAAAAAPAPAEAGSSPAAAAASMLPTAARMVATAASGGST